MANIDDAIFYACAVVFVVHSLTALLVVTHGRCSVYAATFLIACAMWLDLSVLNLWFFLPKVVQEAHRIEFCSTGNLFSDVAGFVTTLALGDPAWYLGLMLAGWFVGSMSLSNGLVMWQREGCDALDDHSHSGLARWVVEWAYWAEEYVGIADIGMLPGCSGTEGRLTRSKQSVLFAVPRHLHRYYLLLVAQPIRLAEYDDIEFRGEKA